MESSVIGSSINMEMNKDYDISDDAFYEEIRRQILVLTADDEDEDEDFVRSKCKQGPSRLSAGRVCSALQPGSYFSWWESCENTNNAVPVWLVNLWRNGNGTGVFIPQIIKSRRRYRPGRMKNTERRSYKQVQRSNYA